MRTGHTSGECVKWTCNHGDAPPHLLCSATTRDLALVLYGFVGAGLVSEHLAGEVMLSFSWLLSASCDVPGEHLKSWASGLVQDDSSEPKKAGPGNN